MLENKGFQGEKVIPYVMPPERSIDIDTVIDFKTSENLMKERGKL
jgi:N-acylneuraminate cytidylyltransferase